MSWYTLVSQVGGWLSSPFTSLYYQFGVQLPMLGAVLLGMVGAFAPCQLSGNVAAFSLFGKRITTSRLFKLELMLFILGKVTIYTGLGLLIFLFGQQLSTEAIPIFQWARKLLAPLFIIIGLFQLNILRFRRGVNLFSNAVENMAERSQGMIRPFLLGAAFSLGFCPTMFWLFFGLLLPMMFANPVGFLLPPLFSIGTTIPLLIIFVVITLWSKPATLMKVSRQWGAVIQRISGIIFILLGTVDFLTFWNLSW